MLETRLDSHILEHWIGIEIGQSIFNYRYRDLRNAFDEEAMELMNRVAKYRKIYPPRTDSNSVRTTLNEAINHYIELFNKPNND